jgi:hypothetical protein
VEKMTLQRRSALFEVTDGLGRLIAILESVKKFNIGDPDLQLAMHHLEADLIDVMGKFHEKMNNMFEDKST